MTAREEAARKGVKPVSLGTPPAGGRKMENFVVMDWRFIKKRLHYAWIVCFGCVLIFFCTCGLSINVYSVYQPFLISDLGFTQTQLGFLTTVRSLAHMASFFVLSKYYHRFSLRTGLLLAAVINISGYIIFGLTRSFPMYLLGIFLVGFGYGLSCMVPLSMLLERWFVKDRTLAVSICCAASGMATLGVPGLITSSIERNGLSRTFLIEAGIMTVMAGFGLLILREDPKKMKMAPFGETEQLGGTQTSQSFSGNLQKKDLIPVYAMIFLMGGICGPGWGCLSLLASTQGYTASVMALGITLAGAALMGGKFLYGYLGEKITVYKTTMHFFVALILGGVLLCLSGLGAGVLLGGCFIYGGSLSLITVGLVSWTCDWFRPEEQNEIKRRFQLVYSIGSLVFGMIPGIVADATGSYVPTYLWFTATSGICMFIMYRTYQKARRNSTG